MSKYEDFLAYSESLGCNCTKNELMSKHTTFKIGGPADIYINVINEKNLKLIVKYAANNNIPLFVLGNGSNLLVSDKGIEGVVISLYSNENIVLKNDNTVYCSAGTKLSALCNFALQNSLTGLEFAWGIPGTVGGAVYMNAGAYGSEMKDVLVSCDSIDKFGNFRNFNLQEMQLGYRSSVFSNNNYIITGADFKLKKGNYNEIKKKMDELLNSRKTKQPLEFPSAGSVFKRPQGNFAGTLIEKCGLKGKNIGGAEVSVKHAGFIINKGNATCNDVLKLIEYIKNDVFQKTGIMLEQEIAVTGR